MDNTPSGSTLVGYIKFGASHDRAAKKIMEQKTDAAKRRVAIALFRAEQIWEGYYPDPLKRND